ncbi:MAG: hypothetical protein ABL982_12705 [Vicinamibacterales bacterium]
MRVLALLLVAHVAVISTVSAQSLADVARKESERRQTVQGGSKSYTNTDLKPVPGAPPADAVEPGDAAKPESDSASADAKPKADGDADARPSRDSATSGRDAEEKDQEYWSKRVNALREQLERDQTYLDALQTRVDSLTADFVNRDDPAQRGQIANDRQKALGEIDRLKKAIEQDKAAIPELEEEARRAGVPAGWLR